MVGGESEIKTTYFNMISCISELEKIIKTKHYLFRFVMILEERIICHLSLMSH
jgi:hypothetical protein